MGRWYTRGRKEALTDWLRFSRSELSWPAPKQRPDRQTCDSTPYTSSSSDSTFRVMSNKRYQWRNDNNQWVDFAPDVSADLLAAFSRGDSTTEINVPNRGVYIINFSDMRQIQKTNAHRWRRIRYTEDQSSYSKHSSSNNQSGHNSQPTSPQATTRSPGDDIFVGT